MAELKELIDLRQQTEETISKIINVLNELEDLKNDVKNAIKASGKDARFIHIITEQRKTLVDLFKIILDYNVECSRLRERLLMSVVKVNLSDKDKESGVDRELLDTIVRKIETTQARVEEEKKEIKVLLEEAS